MTPEKKKNIATRAAITTIVLVIAGIYYYSELRPFEYEGYEKDIDKIQRFDAQLNESIVKSRFGILKYYDPIDDALEGIQQGLNIFKAELSKHPNAEIYEKLHTLEDSIHQKEALVAKFKRINPVLINAISQYSTIMSQIIEAQSSEQLVESAFSQDYQAQLEKSGHEEVLNKIRDLFRGILVYINLRKEENHKELVNLIADIRKAPKLEEMFPRINIALSYADKILELQPKMSDLDVKIFEIPIVPGLKSLTDSFKFVYEQYLNSSYTYRILLYVLIFSLLIVLRWAFSQLRGMVSALHIEIQRKIKAEKELEQINRQLEQRVAERTKELTAKNTDLNKALGDLKEAQDQLIIQEKMASVGMLTTGIAHEIKNPLNFVNNFSDISVELVSELKEEIQSNKEKLGDEASGYIEDILNDLQTNCSKIKEHGERADTIVKTMLMHSQEAGVQKEVLDVARLMEDNYKVAYESFAACKIEPKIEQHYDPKVEKILAAPQTLGRAFIYIIDNALYAMCEKLSKNEPGYEPLLKISIEPAAPNVIIKIRDNGVGIPAKTIAKVFEPFYTTKPTGKGNTGLGLSICYDTIVKQHKGELKVLSEEGLYTEFVITLPVNSRNMEN